jgi:hypothetical protein
MKIKLELTDKEAKDLMSVLDGGLRELAAEMRQISPIRDPLWHAHLTDMYQTSERIYNNLREPYLV